MDPEAALEYVQGQPGGRVSFKHLVRTLGLKGPERAGLQMALDQLASDGKIIEDRRGHYKLVTKGGRFVTGTFSQHPSGFGFVIPDSPIKGAEGDVKAMTEARQCGDRLGLNPAAMLKNRWRVRADEVTEQREAKKAAPGAKARRRLKVADNAVAQA